MFTNMYDIYQQPTWFVICLMLALFWSIFWNGTGLWYSARNGHKGWFIAILLLNTLGLLPIIYVLWFNKKEENYKVNVPVEEEPLSLEVQKAVNNDKSNVKSRNKKVKRKSKI